MEKEVDLQKLCKKEMFWGTKYFPCGCRIYMNAKTRMDILNGSNVCYGSEIVTDNSLGDYIIRFSDEEETDA